MITTPGRHYDVPEVTTVVFSKLFGERVGNPSPRLHFAVIGNILYYLRNVVIIFKVFIKGKFIVHPHPNQYGHCHPDC